MNAWKPTLGALLLLGMAVLGPAEGLAQQPQIPTLQACNPTKVAGNATVFIQARKDAAHAGTFTVAVKLSCDPAGNGYPAGSLEMKVDMSDSTVGGALVATTFEQATTTGKHTPTTYLNGRCKADRIRGCRYWMMLADNKRAEARGTPDVIGFLVFDATGHRVAYGTGPVAKGDISIAATGF